MSAPLIILCGQAGSGKDTAAEILAEHGAAPLALADPLKRFVGKVLGISEASLWGGSEERERLIPFYLNQSRSNVLDHVDQWFADLGITPKDETRRGVYWTWLESLQRFAADNAGKVSARVALQLLGTEWGRATVGENLWIDHGIQVARARCYAVRNITVAGGSGASGRPCPRGWSSRTAGFRMKSSPSKTMAGSPC